MAHIISSAICQQLGITRRQLRDCISTHLFDDHLVLKPRGGVDKYKDSIITPLKDYLASQGQDVPEESIIEEAADTQTITTKSSTIKTVDEALDFAKVDRQVWEVDRFVVNSWEMGYKAHEVREPSGSKHVTAGSHPLWQVKVWLRRKVSRVTVNVFESLCQRLDNHVPAYTRRRYVAPKDPHLLEISIADMHFGKLAWRRETGEDYDLRIAENLFKNAVQDLLRKAAGYPIERIVLPIGNDFLHIDNLENTTAKGTVQDVDGRFVRIMETGQMALIHAIDLLQTVAPVDVVLVAGNHDLTTSWHTARFLWAYYRRCDNVTVDIEPRLRKYITYGNNLIGLTHEPLKNLPILMATEQPQEWANTSYHEWHTAHFHKKGEMQFVSVNGNDGVIVRALPSLTGRDEWHYAQGYIGTRLAEAYLFSKEHGTSGTLYTTGQC